MKIDDSLARNIGFEVANFQVLRISKENSEENIDFEAAKYQN